MKVKDLVKLLMDMDQEATVVVPTHAWGNTEKINVRESVDKYLPGDYEEFYYEGYGSVRPYGNIVVIQHPKLVDSI